MKRIYWETIKKWAINAGIPIGIVGFTLLFMYLNYLGLINVTGYSGDSVCAGTLEDPCYAYINFTVKEDLFIYPIGYDPYGRDTPFYTDKALKEWKIYRKWGAGWREIDLTDTCKGTWCGGKYGVTDNKYSYAFRKGKDYQIKIEAYKENAFEDIKWGFGPVDPVWKGLDWIIEDNSVYINDSKVFISVTPHTIYSSDYIQIDFMSKVYSGDIDFLIGFADEIKPSKAEIYSPHYINKTRNLTCNYDFGYILIPEKRAWCFYNENGTKSYIFNHTFEWGSIQEKTIYWNETTYKEWKSFKKFKHINYDFQGINKWYYLSNVPIQTNHYYSIRSYLEVPINSKGKYWIALKPSDETLQEAIQNNHLYYLDPWYNSSFNYKKEINIIELSGKDLYQYSIRLNVTKESGMRSDYGDLRFVNSTETGELSYWIENFTDDYAIVYVKIPKLTANINTTIYMYYGNAGATSKSNGNDTFIFFEGFEDGDASDWSSIFGSGTMTATTDIARTGNYSGELYSTSNNVRGKSLGYTFSGTTNPALGYSFYKISGTPDSSAQVSETSGYDVSKNSMNQGMAVPDNMISYRDSSSYKGFRDMNINIFYKVEMNNINYATDTYDIYINDVLNKTLADFRNDVSTGAYFQIFTSTGDYLYIDNIYIRNWTDPEPNYSFGPEQSTNPQIGLEIISPLGNINVVQNQSFSAIINVTCLQADCGEINVSLDPSNINLTAGNITEDGYVQLTFEWERDTTSTEILASDSGDQYGFIEFDTSAIPDGATINSVKLRIYADNPIPAPQDLYIKSMSGKKLSDYSNDDSGNEDLKNDIIGASSIGSESLSASTAEWVEITLDSNAETYLQNQLGDD